MSLHGQGLAHTTPFSTQTKLDSAGVELVPTPIPIRSVIIDRWWDSARRLAVYPVVVAWDRERCYVCSLPPPYFFFFSRLNK